MKTVSVHIADSVAREMDDLSLKIGWSKNKMHAEALSLWLEVEAPALISEHEARQKRREMLRLHRHKYLGGGDEALE